MKDDEKMFSMLKENILNKVLNHQGSIMQKIYISFDAYLLLSKNYKEHPDTLMGHPYSVDNDLENLDIIIGV